MRAAVVDRPPTLDPRAACRDAAPREVRLFVGVDPADESPYPPSETLAYCDRCPIRDACLRWALDHREVGVWGGTSTAQRRALRRVRQRRTCPVCAADALADARAAEAATVTVCLACGASWTSSLGEKEA